MGELEDGRIAIVEAGLPVLVIDGGGKVASDLESVVTRLEAKGCHVLHLVDQSGLPEELTPITLAVLGQLLAHHVAVARGMDPDRPPTVQKVTRTWHRHPLSFQQLRGVSPATGSAACVR